MAVEIGPLSTHRTAERWPRLPKPGESGAGTSGDRTHYPNADVLYARQVLFDAFVCHASEDKDDLVRPLVERLREEHIEVWYDEFSLQVGDSLRRSIDRGLSQSRFGIVVLSPHFFGKQWSQWELDGLVARQNDGGANIILPIWHGVERSDIITYSPPLADKLAASSANGIDDVVQRLVAVIRPQGSTLVIARNHLLDWGCTHGLFKVGWFRFVSWGFV